MVARHDLLPSEIESEFMDYEKHRHRKEAFHCIHQCIPYRDARRNQGLRSIGPVVGEPVDSAPPTKRIRISELPPPMPSDSHTKPNVNGKVAAPTPVVPIDVDSSPPDRKPIDGDQLMPATDYDFYCKPIDAWIPRTIIKHFKHLCIVQFPNGERRPVKPVNLSPRHVRAFPLPLQL